MRINHSSLYVDKITILLNGKPVVNDEVKYWQEASEQGWISFYDSSKSFGEKHQFVEGDVKFVFDTSDISEDDMRRGIEKYG